MYCKITGIVYVLSLHIKIIIFVQENKLGRNDTFCNTLDLFLTSIYTRIAFSPVCNNIKRVDIDSKTIPMFL